jgi:hypothetical protein
MMAFQAAASCCCNCWNAVQQLPWAIAERRDLPSLGSSPTSPATRQWLPLLLLLLCLQPSASWQHRSVPL